MDLNQAIKLAGKLAQPNEVVKVSIDEAGGVVLETENGELASDEVYKEFEATLFLEEHPLVPKGW